MKWLLMPLLLLLTLALTSCGGGNKGTIVVASKDFTEQFIIGEMYALLLEDAGYTVER
ncbi:MAG: quaternary ammonium transporter, partial [Chloroflexi bacterium]|nr:quaternary ammonium transporter [Chloroflexota bacterium]